MKFFTVLLFVSLAATSLALLPGKCTFLSALLSLLQAMGCQVSKIATLVER